MINKKITLARIKEKLENIQSTLSGFENISTQYTHYTSVDAALNIIKHKSFYMTHHRYQNDPSEINYGVEMVLDFLNKNPDVQLIDFEKKFRDFVSEDYHILMSCFCGHQDYLPGWRYYGKDGSGVGINILSKSFPDEYRPRLQSHNVVYNVENQNKLIQKVFEESYEDNDFLSNLFIELMCTILPMIKNPDYQDEKEWRVFSHHIKFENGYFFEPLPTKTLVEGCKKPTYDRLSFQYSDIESIHTGPQLDFLYFKERLQKVLMENNSDIDCIKVIPSKKSYRS